MYSSHVLEVEDGNQEYEGPHQDDYNKQWHIPMGQC